MTRRERLEAKLAKRREWAGSRAQKADAASAAFSAHIRSGPPMGEPIKVGHHSERRHRGHFDKADRLLSRVAENAKMAEHHDQKADGLEAQLEDSIFSDDENAVEALEARIAELEEQREQIKAYHAACRKAARAKEPPPTPPVRIRCLSNLSARIRAAKERIKAVQRQQARKAEAAAAGGLTVKIHEGANWATVTFAEKPAREVINSLKAAGFRWGAGSWSGYADKLPEQFRKTA